MASSASARSTWAGSSGRRVAARAMATSRLVRSWRPSPLDRLVRWSRASASAVACSAARPRSASVARLSGLERLQPEEGGAGAQRRVHLEERVLGGGADQHQHALLDAREQRVLLGLVEPVDLVEEQDRAPALLAETAAGLLDHLAHVLDGGVDRAELLEGLAGGVGDEARQGGLPGAGRAPEDHAGETVGLDEGSQRPARRQQVRLADDLVEGPGPQAGGQRGLAGQPVGGGRGEQVVAHPPDRTPARPHPRPSRPRRRPHPRPAPAMGDFAVTGNREAAHRFHRSDRWAASRRS